MEKFRYAPGMPGYGSKGTDGSKGLSGLAMYASDLAATSDEGINTLTIRINNNLSLFQDEPAPPIVGYDEGRRYQTGDLFVDYNSNVYVINLDNDPPWDSTDITFGGGANIFDAHGIFPIGAKSYTRYANFAAGETTAKLVDSYISTTLAEYPTERGPVKNYNIPLTEFGNIYYNDIPVTGSYNAFNLWSSALSPLGADDANAIGLVRSSTNDWRFGNTTDAGAIRTGAGAPTLSLDFEKVGIGRGISYNAPNYALEVIGDVSIGGGSSLFVHNSIKTENNLWIRSIDNTGSYADTNARIKLHLSGIDSYFDFCNRLIIRGGDAGINVKNVLVCASNGYVGIGTGTSPAYNLDVTGNMRVTGTITGSLAGGVASSVVYQSAAGTTALTAAGTNGQFLTLVGTTPTWSTVTAGVSSVTASAPLTATIGANPNIAIPVATSVADGYLSATDWATFNGKAAANQTMYIGTTGVAINRGSAGLALTGVSIDGAAGSVAWTNVSSRPTLLSQFTNDLGNYGGFALAGQTMYIGTTGVAINRGSGALALTGITSIDGNAATATNAYSTYFSVNAGSQSSYNLYVSGTIYATSTIYSNSDIRTKNIFGDMPKVLDYYDAIDLIEYSFKTDEKQKHKYGFSAQNLNELFPLISTHTEEDTYEIDHLGIAALNTQAIKELKAENESLKKRLEILEQIILNK